MDDLEAYIERRVLERTATAPVQQAPPITQAVQQSPIHMARSTISTSMTGTVGSIAFGMALAYVTMSNASLIRSALLGVVGTNEQKKTLSPEAVQQLLSKLPLGASPLSQVVPSPISTPPSSSSAAVVSSS
jgi:hypothetical protein